MKTAMYAIIKKDFRGVASNRRLFSALLIVPLVLTIVLPSIFVMAIHFVPDDPDAYSRTVYRRPLNKSKMFNSQKTPPDDFTGGIPYKSTLSNRFTEIRYAIESSTI